MCEGIAGGGAARACESVLEGGKCWGMIVVWGGV